MSTRVLYYFGFFSVCLLLAISAYLQLVIGLAPCPLCTLQRISFLFVGIFFLCGIFVYNKLFLRLFTTILIAAASGTGLFFSGRQIWLQFFAPPSNTACPANLNYLLKILPANEVLKKILEGSPDCVEHGWTFLSLDLAEWAFVWFLLYLIISLFLLLKSIRKRSH